MLFIDKYFIFMFLPLFLLIYFNNKSNKNYIIFVTLVSSLIFHGIYSIKATLLLCFSIGINYIFLNFIYQNKNVLKLSIIFNLTILIIFKYINFFASIINKVFSLHLPEVQVELPLGISFFTFTQIACLVDAYKEQIKHRTLPVYGAFVSYFPHLIAGPVIHYKPIIPQFLNPRNLRFNMDNFIEGLGIFSLGLSKKIILADNIAKYINPLFHQVSIIGNVSTIDGWLLALGYTFQLYFDFSGYSDMAVGIGRMMNITLPHNFNLPYLATSIIDFWKRWHITLSEFLRDYLYIPLGGNRKGIVMKYMNLMITMVLGGLWHGAGFTYVLWGMYHGIGLILNHIYRDFKPIKIAAPKWAGILTFFFVINGWVIFRAPTIDVALKLFKSMYIFNQNKIWMEPAGGALIISLVVGYFLWYWLKWKSTLVSSNVLIGWSRKLSTSRSLSLFIAGILFTISLVMSTDESPFLYFQF